MLPRPGIRKRKNLFEIDVTAYTFKIVNQLASFR